jgi:hypothetical protein
LKTLPAKAIALKNRIVVEIHTASFRTTRGYSIVAALQADRRQARVIMHRARSQNISRSLPTSIRRPDHLYMALAL